MSLIEKVEPVEPTKEQNLTQVKRRIKNMSKQINDGIAKRHSILFNVIWNNRKNLTPQEILDELGTDAAELFTYSVSIQTLLATADPDYVVLETPNEYVVNPDGTVTIGIEKI